jgi:di-heme oxidoreductase (putative peroxidase)
MRRSAPVPTTCMLFGVLAVALPRAGRAEVGSGVPSDADLSQQRMLERTPGFFVIDAPPPGTPIRPVQRVPRDSFGVVGPFPLKLEDLAALVYPDETPEERQTLLEGMTFFTTPHAADEGAGPMANQPFCLGCHTSSAEQIRSPGLVSASSCLPGSTCISLVSRAARATPTNFEFTQGDSTHGGRAADHLDALFDTGQTAAFTIFGDFSPSANFQDPLDGSTMNRVTGQVSQPFGGFVQHTRPALPACLPDRIPSISEDHNLGTIDPATGLSPLGFRRSVGERAGPPYIGRGLMEAVPNADILANEDPGDTQGHSSSLGNFAAPLGCTGDCISGRHNEIPTNANFVSGLGRFGLRANGAEIVQFSIGGLQGELGFTSLLNNNEINLPDIDTGRAGCVDMVPDPEAHLSIVFSERNFIRNTAPPEFGDTLLRVLTSPDPSRPQPGKSPSAKVQRGAMLFGIDLTAFANRMIPGRMSGDDGRDPHAINQADRMLNCVGCHTPVQRTGQSPADVGAEHLTHVWAPIFSDLLLHAGPVIDAERFSPLPRDPLVIRRQSRITGAGVPPPFQFDTFDLPRNLADDVFSNLQASALGPEFRTAPLMGLGRMGPPFLHDARVYASQLTVDTTPAGTVTTSSDVTNAPLVVHTLDDAIRAAIELHDLPAPDDARTPNVPGAGCPVPPAGSNSNVSYGRSPADVICPPYDSTVSQTHRGEAREVIRRFRGLSTDDQQALIEFLKQL